MFCKYYDKKLVKIIFYHNFNSMIIVIEFFYKKLKK